MFGIGFTELLLIGVVALIVIGPERLPKVARTAGAWLGRLNRYAAQVKAEVNREMQLDELRKAQQSMQESVQKYEIMAEQAGARVDKEVGELGQAVTTAAKAAAEPVPAKPAGESGDKAA